MAKLKPWHQGVALREDPPAPTNDAESTRC